MIWLWQMPTNTSCTDQFLKEAQSVKTELAAKNRLFVMLGLNVLGCSARCNGHKYCGQHSSSAVRWWLLYSGGTTACARAHGCNLEWSSSRFWLGGEVDVPTLCGHFSAWSNRNNNIKTKARWGGVRLCTETIRLRASKQHRTYFYLGTGENG